MPPRPRILLVQYAGDFREADRVLRETGKETYYGHRYVLETLTKLHRELAVTSILCCRTDDKYVATLDSGVTVMGAGADPFADPDPVIRLIDEFGPTHMVLLSPITEVLRHCVQTGVRVICLWADSFSDDFRTKHVRRRRLRRLIRDERVEWVGNHGRNACRSLVRFGVDPSKIIAWDWPHHRSPREAAVRENPGGVVRLFFAGLLIPSKGIFDLVEAVALLARQGFRVELRIAGSGDEESLRETLGRLGVREQTTLLGLIPNDRVVAEMGAASAVVVPSRHDYAEGLPLTIYEALASRTPIVASDHPMFAGILEPDVSALVFNAGRPRSMAAQIGRLVTEDGLYERLSSRAEATWSKIQIEAKWGEIIERWLRNSHLDRRWLAEQSSTST